MSNSSMDEAVRNWPITVEWKKNSRLWLVNFLLFSLIHSATAHCRRRFTTPS